MLPPPPRSTLFPYTTLFRSEKETSSTACTRWRRIAPPIGNVFERSLTSSTLMLPPGDRRPNAPPPARSEEHTSELQSRRDLVCRLLLEKKKKGTDLKAKLPS